ncbi:unnamed protein product [Blepharisma stoltei]|uniref:Uncharacterized protein n=1 Tax=Blepharisma stoltei TaxID=1481888 RepID=A0AAU9KQ50_9CILI|nr:unnamed protein product [Blepharisma stoltei]
MEYQEVQPYNNFENSNAEISHTLLWSYLTLFQLNSVAPLNIQVPETIIIGFKFPSNAYMHNKLNGDLCFESLLNEEGIHSIAKKWGKAAENTSNPVAEAKYMVNSTIQSYSLISENSIVSESTYLQFRNKIIQQYISSENLIKTNWNRKKKTFEIEHCNFQPKFNLKLSSTSRNSLPNIRAQSPTPTLQNKTMKNGLGRLDKERLKENSFYLIQKLYYFLKKFKKVKLDALSLVFAKSYNRDWMLMYIDSIKCRKMAGRPKFLPLVLNSPCQIVHVSPFETGIEDKEEEIRSLLEEVKILQEKMSELIINEEKEQVREDKKGNFAIFIRALKGKRTTKPRDPTHPTAKMIPSHEKWIEDELSRVANLLDGFKSSSLSSFFN